MSVEEIKYPGTFPPMRGLDQLESSAVDLKLWIQPPASVSQNLTTVNIRVPGRVAVFFLSSCHHDPRPAAIAPITP